MLDFDHDLESENLKPFISFLDEKVRQVEDFDMRIIDLQIEAGKELLRDQRERLKDLETKRLHVSLIVLGVAPYYFIKVLLLAPSVSNGLLFLIGVGSISLLSTTWYSFRHYGGISHIGEGSLPSILFTKLTAGMTFKEHKLTQLSNLEYRARINKQLMTISNKQLIRQMYSLLITVAVSAIVLAIK